MMQLSKKTIAVHTISATGILISPCDFTDKLGFFQVEQGEATAFIGAKEARLSEGAILCIPEGVVMLASSDKGASATLISVPFSSLAANMERLDGDLLGMFLWQSKARPFVMTPDAPLYDTALQVLDHMKTESAAKETCYRLLLRADACRLLAYLLRYYGEARKEGDRLLYHNVARISEVLSYATAHITDKMTVGMLSERMNLSADYFSRMLYESIGQTAVKFLQSVRINEAMRLLLTTDASPSQIAKDVGYGGRSSLDRIFKTHLGMTLSEFLALCRN